MKKPESQLQELVTRLQQACGENLVSIVLYGSAARDDFHEQFSDVNAAGCGAAPGAGFVCGNLGGPELVESRGKAAAAADHDARGAA